MAKVRVNWGALPEGEAVFVFDVINTAFKHQFVLAKDSETAMRVAYSAGHVMDYSEIHEDYYFRAPHKIELSQHKVLREYENVIQRAIERRLQGTLHIDGNEVCLGSEAI